MSGIMAMANNKHVMDLIPVVTSFLVGMAGGAVLIWSTGLAKTINTKERKRRTCAIEEDVVNAFVPHYGEENGDDDDEEENILQPECVRDDWKPSDGPLKLVLVVNMGLKMGKGKLAAQCCHGAVGCYKSSSKYSKNALHRWEWLGQAKICLKCPTESEMLEIRQKASDAGLVTYLVLDAGRTQIASGSRTVLSIGPAPSRVFEGITDHLKLL